MAPHAHRIARLLRSRPRTPGLGRLERAVRAQGLGQEGRHLGAAHRRPGGGFRGGARQASGKTTAKDTQDGDQANGKEHCDCVDRVINRAVETG